MSSSSASTLLAPPQLVSLYKTMIWLSCTVRPNVDTSDYTCPTTKTYSTYKKQKCTPIKRVQLLNPEDPRHPLKVLERYKGVFEDILFSDIPSTSCYRLGMTTEIEQDVRDGVSNRPPESHNISNETELAGFYDQHVLRPAVEMVKVILTSNQCPKELQELAASGLPLSIRSPGKTSATSNPNKEVVLTGRHPGYDRTLDVALLTDARLLLASDDKNQRSITNLVEAEQDDWQEFGLQGVERGKRPRGALLAVWISPFHPVLPLYSLL
jgi:hypothetical protein